MRPASANTDNTFVRDLICVHVFVTLLPTSSGMLFSFFSEEPEITPDVLSLSLLSVRSSVDASSVFLSVLLSFFFFVESFSFLSDFPFFPESFLFVPA